MVKHIEKDSDLEGGNVVSCMCPCGKEPLRIGQRNGLKCHAKANREYRQRVKRESERIADRVKAMTARIDRSA